MVQQTECSTERKNYVKFKKGYNTVFGYKEEATADMCVKNSVLFKGRKITDVINIRRSAVKKMYLLFTDYLQYNG